MAKASVTLGKIEIADVEVIGPEAVAEIPLLDLPDHPEDRAEWVAAFEHNLDEYALNAAISRILGLKVRLTVEGEHLERDVALLQHVVENTSERLGDPEERRMEWLNTQRAAEEDLHKHEADVLGRFNRALGYRADE
jgi:hypothetical protein